MLHQRVHLVALLVVGLSCANGQNQTEKNEPTPTTDPAARNPVKPTPESDKPAMSASPSTDSASAVSTLVKDNTLAELTWPQGKARVQLEAIDDAVDQLRRLCSDASVTEPERFKACEAMFTLGGKLSDDDAKLLAARAYTAALTKDSTHNVWGLPETITSSATSRHLISLGKLALPFLAPLLEDDRKLLYEGSEEPTISEMHDYRIYDLAGSLVGQILAEPYPFAERKADQRKQAADKLRAKLRSN